MLITNQIPLTVGVTTKGGAKVNVRFRIKNDVNDGRSVYIKVITQIHVYYKPIADGASTNSNIVYLASSDRGEVISNKDVSDLLSVDMIVPNYIGNPVNSHLIIWLEPSSTHRSVRIQDLITTDTSLFSVPSMVDIINPINSPINPINSSIIENVRETYYDNIVYVSTWDKKCGIAFYTQDLIKNLEMFGDEIGNGNRDIKGNIRDKVTVRDIGSLYGDANSIYRAKLWHLQHEFGIMPSIPNIKGPALMTFHTILPDMSKTIKEWEEGGIAKGLDIKGYIVPNIGAYNAMRGRTNKDLFIVSLGSKLIYDEIGDNIKNVDNIKIEARRRVGINDNGIGGDNKPIAFVFGFQSGNKKYNEMIEAVRSKGLHLLISGSVHASGFNAGLSGNNDITVLGRHLNDEEIDLYALASDILLFDYTSQSHYSSSAALHRVVGAGRPVICCRTNHFEDIDENRGECIKFGSTPELVDAIGKALYTDHKEKLEKGVLEFARRTSWREVVRQHLDIYRKYEGL